MSDDWRDTILDLFHGDDADITALKAGGCEAVILKATQGVQFIDPKFAERKAAADAAGLLVGAFHFADASPSQAQVDHFLSIAKGISVLAIDLEPNEGKPGGTVSVAQAAEIASLIESRTGRKPLIYTGRYGPDGKGTGFPNAILAACPLWLAEYQAATPKLPPGWDDWVMWQWTDAGSFAGVKGDCDRDRFNGTTDDLKTFWGTSGMTATKDVLSVIRESGLDIEAQAFLAAIAEGEGGSTFRVLFSGGTELDSNPNVVTTDGERSWTGSLDAFPNWAGAVLENGLITTAAGAFQDTKTTWTTEIIKLAGAKTDFSPATQVANNWLFAVSRFKSRSGGRDLLTTLRDGPVEDVNNYLARTWIGGADAGFAKRYAANLDTLKVPPPSEITISLSSPIKLSGVDQAGNPVSVLIKLAAAALMAVGLPLMLMARMAAPDAAAKPPPTIEVTIAVPQRTALPVPPTTAVSAPIPAKNAEPNLFDTSTFCFGPGLTVIRNLEECHAWRRAP